MEDKRARLISHMALLRNVANDLHDILGSNKASDFIEAAMVVINDSPKDGKLIDIGRPAQSNIDYQDEITQQIHKTYYGG